MYNNNSNNDYDINNNVDVNSIDIKSMNDINIKCMEEHQLYNQNKIKDALFKVYILRLASNKYYVGKTNRNVDERFMEHINSEGAAWTKKYKPIEIMESFETNDKFDEDKHTLKMMDKYGIENVRGGSFAGEILTNEQIGVIEQIINGCNDKCFRCGSSEHFVHNCPLKIGKKYNIYNSNITGNAFTKEQTINRINLSNFNKT